MDRSKFCYDIKMEILSRTSLKTLDTMRCTNKEFEKLSYDHYFLNLYKQRNDIVSGFLVQRGPYACSDIKFAPSHGSNSVDLTFLPRKAGILASSEQGIIVFQSRSDLFYYEPPCYHVCKPATKQVLELPNPQTKYPTLKVALVVMGSNPLHYKILKLSQPIRYARFDDFDQITYCCEIFDSKAWAWRLLQDLILPSPVYLSDKQLDAQPITTNGSIYMLLDNKKILKFDAYSEKWTTFSSPIQPLHYDLKLCQRKLVKYKGKLGLACLIPSLCSWEIWGLKVNQSWEKLHILNLDYYERNSAFLGNTLKAIYDSDTRVAWEEKSSLAFYRFKGGDCISKFPIFKDCYYSCPVFPLRSDFELVDLRG